MSEHCNHCAETDEKIQAAEKRIKELEGFLKDALPHIECLTKDQDNLITAIGKALEADPLPDATKKVDQISQPGKKVEPDPWLGVWRAKKAINLSNGKIWIALRPEKPVEVVAIINGEAKIKLDNFIIHMISAEFLQKNFEKVEEGEG